MGLDISPVRGRRDVDAFLKVPAEIRPQDRANAVPPPWMGPLLDRRSNPYFRHADHELFLIRRGGRPLGRIAVFVDHLCNRTLGEQTGIFGLFDCANSQRVASDLLAVAEQWFVDQSVNLVRGPMGPSMRLGTGVLVDGLGQPPMPGLSYDPPEISFLLEQAGYRPKRDLHAYRLEVGRISRAVTRSADRARRHKGLVLRRVRSDRAHFDDEMMRLREVINDLPASGRVCAPWSESEIKWVADKLRLIIDPNLVLFVEQDRVPAGLGVAVRNIREIVGGRSPRETTLDVLRIAAAFRLRRFKSARIPMLAVRPQFQFDAGFGKDSEDLGGILALLLTELLGRLRLQGIRWAEVSLVDPIDRPLVELLSAAGGEPYKTYRVYEKNL